MDVFSLRNRLITDYASYVQSFIHLRDPLTSKKVYDSLSEQEYKFIKSKKLVEGRYPNIFVSSHIAAVTGDKTAYIRNRAFDDAHYKKMIISFLTEYGSASRKDIDNLLLDKLSDALDEQQKKNKVRNLIYAMANKDNTIVNQGSSAKPHWVLTGSAI